MGEAFAPAIAGRRDAHQPRIEPVLNIALEDAILDQDILLGRRTLVVDRQRTTPVGDRSVIDHGHARRRNAFADAAGKGAGALAIEIALEPMADRLMQQDAGPARPKQHGHLARRRGDRIEIDHRLRQRFIDRAVPGLGLHQLIVEIAPTKTESAGFAPAILFDHDRHVQAHQRTDIGRDKAVGTDDLDHAPRSRERDRDLRDARIARAGSSIDRLAQIDLVGEGHEVERIGIGIKMPVGALWRAGLGTCGRIDQRHRLGSTVDCGRAQFIGMRESGGFARHGAQAKARLGVVARGFQPAIVEAECLGLAILQIEFAIVRLGQGLRGQALGLFGLKLAGMVEKGAGVCRTGHARQYSWLRGWRQTRYREASPDRPRQRVLQSARSADRNSRNRHSPARRSAGTRADGQARRRREYRSRRHRRHGHG